MNTRVTLDKTGRIVIPKPLREELHLEPGDALEMEGAGEQIILRPVRETSPLAKEHGVWVLHTGQPLPVRSTDEYADALQTSSALGIVGGGIYDAMLAHCAVKAEAEAIYSWNGRHYTILNAGQK
jgi:AbrB family looped-hinge helix DNA binding protein